MCRAIADGGRRCPGSTDPLHRQLVNIKQRIGRYHRKAQAANDAHDWDRVARYADLLDRDVTAYEKATTTAPAKPPTRSETRAADYTPQATLEWSDDALIAELNRLEDDPEAQDQILATLDWRSDMDRQRDADIAAAQEQQARDKAEREAAWKREWDDASPLTNPARRPERRLKPEQVCREEYDMHLYTSFLAAENDCRGVLLNREGQAKGIDPKTLFSGPAVRARRYASEELKTWWARNGRITYAEWKFEWFGRESDRSAARTAKYQSLGEATA